MRAHARYDAFVKSKHPQATPISRKLRREASPPERKLWRALQEAFPEDHWRRQVPLAAYFADFALHAQRLVIEVDRDYHDAREQEDAFRQQAIEEQGYKVLRFPARDVMMNMEGVLTTIGLALTQSPAPNPSPQGGGEPTGIRAT